MSDHDDIRPVLDQLAHLAPTGADADTAPEAALVRLRAALPAETPAHAGAPTRNRWRLPIMSIRKLSVAGVLVAILALAFTFPTVRAAASDFLGLFRVQKFAPISISPAQLARLEELAQEGLYPGELRLDAAPEPSRRLNSLSEARGLVRGWVRTPSLMASSRAPDIMYQPGSTGSMTVNLEGARAILSAVDADPALLPDSLDGAVISAEIFPAIVQTWPDGTSLVQMQSPIIDYPEGVDPAPIGEALLQILGMPADEAARLSRNIDWTNTLLLPIPQDLASFAEVPVDGTTGLAISEVGGRHNAILWQRDNTVYLLTGGIDLDFLVDVADSLR